MTTVTQGNTDTYTFAANEMATLSLSGGQQARVEVADATSGKVKYGATTSVSETFGPFNANDVLSVTAIRGTVTYTISTYSVPSVGAGAIARSTAQLAGTPSGADVALGANGQFYDPLQTVDATHPWVYYSATATAYVQIGSTGGGAVSSVAGKTGAVTLAVEDLSNGAALNTTIANKFALPTQNYNGATNTPAITQGSALTVSGTRVFSVLVTVGSTSSAGPFSTVAVGDILTDNGSGTWSRFPAPPVTLYPICGDGLGGERAGVPSVDFAVPLTLNATVPVSSRPTGITVGTNGALTTAPYTSVYGPTGGVPGVWVWFALNDLWSGNVAGYYWCVFTSLTAGTAYQDRYTPGVNSGANTSSNHSWLPPASPTAISGAGSGTALVADGTRRSFFAIPMDGSAGNLPVGYMGPNGWAETEVLATYPSSTNNKAVSTSLSSTSAGATNQIGLTTSTATTSNTLFSVRGKVSNRNSQSSQIGAGQSTTGSDAWLGNSTPVKTTVNLAAACFYTLDALSASEYIVVERAQMRVSPN